MVFFYRNAQTNLQNGFELTPNWATLMFCSKSEYPTNCVISDADLYIAAWYWAIQTVATVG